MRRLYVLFLTLFLVSAVYAQNTSKEKTTPKAEAKTETKAETKTDAKTDAKTENKETVKPAENGDKTEKLPDGYGSLTWGMYLSEARDKITGTLTYTDEKTLIVSKDKEMQYYYGFFYKAPSADAETVKKEDTTAADKQPETVQEKDEGKLFYVSLNFPYLDKDQVYEKIQKKYGKHTGENLKDNQGAIAWDSQNTVVIMWIDRYEKKPFCRKIIYISKPISKELNEYTGTIFNKTEIELLKKMNP
jgi:hypothetical protein